MVKSLRNFFSREDNMDEQWRVSIKIDYAEVPSTVEKVDPHFTMKYQHTVIDGEGRKGTSGMVPIAVLDAMPVPVDNKHGQKIAARDMQRHNDHLVAWC